MASHINHVSDSSFTQWSDTSTEPYTITFGGKYLYVFTVGVGEGALWAKVHDTTAAANPSAAWHNLGGVCQSAPVAVSWGPDHISVFVIGCDRQAWECKWDGSKWGWKCLAGVKFTEHSLTACSWGTGRIDLFGIGTDSALKHLSFNKGVWNVWENLGGLCIGKPKAVAPIGNRLDIFLKGGDSKLYHIAWSGSKWEAYNCLGGEYHIFQPEAVVWCNHRIDVFSSFHDGSVVHMVGDVAAGQGNWGSWEKIISNSTPKAVTRDAKKVDILYSGVDSAVWHKLWDGSKWVPNNNDFESLGGILITKPT
ncbi:hypothetical protein LTR28_011873 [Elasticomyces elasticus]|nr:hypothetical protein LTR28_011873 [Elasticomyces elasticus]